MKKIFLTSGLVLCMACPAFAEYPLGDIGTNNYLEGTDPAKLADCTVDTLGLAGYTGPVTLEAKWVSNQATITLDDNYYIDPTSNTVTWAPATPVPTAEKTLYTVYGVSNQTPGAGVFYIPDGQSTKTAISNLTSGTPAKTGYTFGGFWTERGGTGTQYISNAGEISSSLADYLTANPGTANSATLYASWTPLQYTIAYANGSTGGSSTVSGSVSSDTVTFDTVNHTFKSASGFSATGYHFTGWQSTYDLTDGSTPQGGVLYRGSQSSTPNGDYAPGALVGNYGYNAPVDQTTGLRSVTLTATWAPNKYTVSYLCAGGEPSTASTTPATGTVDSVEVTFDAGYTLDDGASCHLDGYTFNGWSCTNGLSGALVSTTENNVTTISPASGTWSLTTDSVCTAQWTANTIGLTWTYAGGHNPTGGTLGGDECTYDSSIQLPTNPERDGYTFEGWRVVSSD